MRGRAGGLPFYGQPYRAGLPEHLGWGLSPDRLTQWRPALWPNPDGSPRELWAVRGGKIERLHVSHEGSWRFDSMGSARFPDPDATKGLGTVRMIPAPDSPFPHLLVGDNDWRQKRPFPGEWRPDLPFGEDMAVRYQGGSWQGRTVAGRVYLACNSGSDAPSYDRLEPVFAGGKQLCVNGQATAEWLVPFADGRLHLIVADFHGDIYDFPAAAGVEVGAGIRPLLEGGLEDGGLLSNGEKPIELPGCIAKMARFDVTGSGYPDLLFITEDGYVSVVANDGARFHQPMRLQQERSIIKTGVLAVPVPLRTESGAVDLYCGTAGGEILHLKNAAAAGEPDFEPPVQVTLGGEPFRLTAGLNGSPHGPNELKWGYLGPVCADWDGDGAADLIFGCITGAYYLAQGEKPAGGLRWGRPVRMTVGGKPLVAMWRVRPAVADWDADGELEMLTLDEHGYLALYKRNAGGGPADLQPPQRVLDETGAPVYIGGENNFPNVTLVGRAKLFAHDWDEDGRLELLIGTHCKLRPTNAKLIERAKRNDGGATVMLVDNVGTPERPVWGRMYAVELTGGRPLDFGRHSCAPIMVDWRREGRSTLVVGTEDGFLWSCEKEELELSSDVVPPFADQTGHLRHPEHPV